MSIAGLVGMYLIYLLIRRIAREENITLEKIKHFIDKKH